MADRLIEAKSLRKQFGSFTAIDGIDLSIERGECFGLLGPNGAGKSTFINLVYGVAKRTGGDLAVFGLDPNSKSRDIKKRLGVVTQDNALDEALTVEENMLLYASFLGVGRSQRRTKVALLLSYMDLIEKRSSKIQSLSGGMRRRLVFVRALLGSPELLILDEPTTGLDPAVRHLIWTKIRDLKRSGTTVLLTTHYMHEAEILCDRLVVMNRGKVVDSGSPAFLISKWVPGFVGVFRKEDREVIMSTQRTDFICSEDSNGIYLRSAHLEKLAKLTEKIELTPLQIRPANLEDVFLKITGGELSAND